MPSTIGRSPPTFFRITITTLYTSVDLLSRACSGLAIRSVELHTSLYHAPSETRRRKCVTGKKTYGWSRIELYSRSFPTTAPREGQQAPWALGAPSTSLCRKIVRLGHALVGMRLPRCADPWRTSRSDLKSYQRSVGRLSVPDLAAGTYHNHPFPGNDPQSSCHCVRALFLLSPRAGPSAAGVRLWRRLRAT
jgi:hypothetical protein